MHEIRSLAAPGRLRIEELLLEGGGVTVRASARGRDAVRPVCGSRSRRVPGHYTRTLADLPWGGVPVRLRVRVRKFFCDEPSCERRIFAERLEKVARPFARGTDRRREALEWIAFALGGQAGARLAAAREPRHPPEPHQRGFRRQRRRRARGGRGRLRL